MALGEVGTYEGYGFQLGVATGVIAAGAAAAAEFIQFRWTGAATQRARIIAVSFSLATDATAFAAGSVLVELVRATAFSVLGTGGSSPALTTKTAATLRTAQLPSRGMTAAVAGTAALTAGTKTLDAAALACVLAGVPNPAVVSNTFLLGDNHAYGTPLVLDNNEGIIIRATVPATGTWRLAATAFWAEIDGN